VQIGGSLILVAALTLAGCDRSSPGDDGSQDEVAHVTPAGTLMPAGVERYTCPDRTLDAPDVKRAVARVSKELRDSGVNPDSRFMDAMEPDPVRPGFRSAFGGQAKSERRYHASCTGLSDTPLHKRSGTNR
jgi:hypothetical protein